jgi:hypothetical protein
MMCHANSFSVGEYAAIIIINAEPTFAYLFEAMFFRVSRDCLTDVVGFVTIGSIS